MAIANFKHSGSVALGSLIHTGVFILKLIVDALVNAAEKKNGRNGNGDNAAIAVIGCLLKCCVRKLEEWVEYLNRMAYAFMAVSGDPYCRSAWNGFIINLKHLMKFYFVDILTSVLVLIGILAVTALNAGSCYLILKYGSKNSDQLSSIWVPIVFIIIYTLITAELFIGFFQEAVTATLMSLAVDIDLNGRIKHGSPSFHEKMQEIYGEYGHDPAQPETEIETSQKANTYQQVHPDQQAHPN